MGEQRIQKRQQRIHVVKRRSPISLSDEKIVFLLENQLVQYAKVKFCTISLDAAKRIRIKTGINALEIFNQQRVTETNFIVIDYIPMVTDTSSKNRPAVDDFSYDEAPGEIQRLLCIVSFSILSTPQEHIAPDPSMNAPQKFSVRRQKREADIIVGTQPHQLGAGPHISKADYTFKIMYRNAKFFSVIDFNDNILSLPEKI